MWRYFGINLLDQDELFYSDWMFMVAQAERWQADEVKEAKSNG